MSIDRDTAPLAVGSFGRLTRRLKSLQAARRSKLRSRKLFFESLEERRVLAVDFLGDVNWQAAGPSPIANGQTEFVADTGPGPNAVAGAIHSVATHPADADIIFIGAVNGGVWRTTNATSANPQWIPLTDQHAGSAIGALAFDPTDAANNTLVAGIGRFSSFNGNGGLLTGILRTTDGGNTFQTLGGADLTGSSITAVLPRGNNILVSSNTGIDLSMDAGVSFTSISGLNGLGAGASRDLAGDPTDLNRVYAAVLGVGIFRSDNLGAGPWTNISSGDAALNAAITVGTNNNLELSVAANGRVFAGVIRSNQTNYIGFSDDQGATWTEMDLPTSLEAPVAITNASNANPIVITSPGHGLNANNPHVLRIAGIDGNTAANGDFRITIINNNTFSLQDLAGNNVAGNGAYIANGGDTWRELNPLQPKLDAGAQGAIHFSILADPNDPNTLYIGGDRQDNPAGWPNSVGADDFSGRLYRGDTTIAAVAPGAVNNPFSPQWEHLTHTQNAGFVNGGTPGDSSPHADSRDMAFDALGRLIEVDDGGVYRRDNPADNTGDWVSLLSNGAGGLQVNEQHDIAYDNNSDIVFSGNQDTGTGQQIATGSLEWTQMPRNVAGTLFYKGDGGDVVVDNLIGGGNSLRYASSQNLGIFQRLTFDAANVLTAVASPTLTLAGAGPVAQAALVAKFVTPLAVNAVVANRLIIGGVNGAFESTDNADNITRISTAEVNGQNGATGSTGNAIAYGGRQGGVDNPDVLYVGAGSQVFARTATTFGGLAATAALPAGAGLVTDVEMDPADWARVFAVDANQVFFSPDAGANWNDITGNLADVNLRTIEYVEGPGGTDVILVGGNLGVYRMFLNDQGTWTELGTNLPNAPVWDMAYDVTDDLLVIGTLGRGAFTVANASTVVTEHSILQICGDADFPNQDDTFLLVRDPNNPLLIQVYVNNVLEFTGPLASIEQINVFAAGGNDTLIVDSTNGLISVDGGIRYDGDHGCPDDDAAGVGGFDRLDLVQTGGSATGATDVLAIGATNGSGRSTITTAAGVQRVDFQNLEPVVDTVPAASFSITGIPGLASLLQGDNAINYSAASLIPPPAATVGGRVTIDAFEPIEFANKATLIINADAGSDEISLNNSTTPTGLTSITVIGGDPTGSDTVIANGTTAANTIVFTPTSSAGGTLTGAGPVDITIATAEHLTINGQGGNDSLTVQGTTGGDIIVYTPGGTQDSGLVQVNSLLPLSFTNVGTGATLHFTDQGGAANKLVYNGTDTNDNFGVNVVGDGIITFQESANSFLGGTDHIRVTVPTAGNLIQALTLNTFDGEDGYVINSSTLFTGGIALNGGNPSGLDRATLNGSAAADAINLELHSGGDFVFGIVGGRIVLTGIEDLTIGTSGGDDAYVIDLGDTTDLKTVSMFAGNDAGDSLTVNGTGSEDTNRFTPTGVGNGRLIVTTAAGVTAESPLFNYTGFAGTLTVNGGGGVDVIEVTATAGNDAINAVQPDATHFNLTLNAFTQIFTTSSVERANIIAGSGDDIIRVSVADALAGSLAISIDGGSPNASDRLIVNDAGIGDLTILRQAPDQRSGSATVGGLNPVFYTDIERLDITPINSVTGGVGTDGNGRIEVFHSDPFEYNDTRLTPATLSRVSENPTRPTIDPGAVVAPFEVPGDEDWYDFRPQATGTFAVKILFDIQGTLANGRAGLPGSGDMNLDIYDALGGLITSGVVTSGGKIAIFAATPDAALFARIFVRVRGATSDSINRYEFDNLDGVGTGNPGVINVDIFGPQVTDVLANNIPTATYNLFGQKPANAAFKPTPLVNSLTIQLRDLPARAPGFLYNAIDPNTATTPGTYVVKGDATGIAVISSIVLVNNPVVQGGVPTASIQINFAQPLPDDRFTLTINDNLLDPAGNKLDGESNAAEPNAAPTFPSGDDHSGNAFVARFTVDSRAELGAWSAGSVYVDTNGNNLFDPTNADATNRDITYLMGFASDNIFAGNFASLVNNPATPQDDRIADGFDKLAAYGKFGASFRWLIDVNNDGIVNALDVNVVQPLFAGVTSVNGTPVAGNFDGNAANGDEVALKVGTTWLLDTNHDFKVDTKLPGTNMSGLPITGDFDGDGKEDLGAWADDLFKIDFGFNGLTGNSDLNFGFGFISVRERPVASDFDGDGITDLGLWVPDRAGVAPAESAEWYLLISAGRSLWTRNAESGGIVFKPAPFGSDRYAQFGDEFGLPVPGNFDPPITPTQPSGSFTNSRDNVDVDNDGFVSPIDALLVINRLNSGDTTMVSTPFTHAPFVDVNGDGSCSPIDALIIINKLNAANGNSAGEGEGESADSFFAELGSDSNSDASLSALLAFDDYHLNRKK